MRTRGLPVVTLLLAVLAATVGAGAPSNAESRPLAAAATPARVGECARRWTVVPTDPVRRGSLAAVASRPSGGRWAVGGVELRWEGDDLISARPLIQRGVGSRWRTVRAPAVGGV